MAVFVSVPATHTDKISPDMAGPCHVGTPDKLIIWHHPKIDTF